MGQVYLTNFNTDAIFTSTPIAHHGNRMSFDYEKGDEAILKDITCEEARKIIDLLTQNIAEIEEAARPKTKVGEVWMNPYGTILHKEADNLWVMFGSQTKFTDRDAGFCYDQQPVHSRMRKILNADGTAA